MENILVDYAGTTNGSTTAVEPPREATPPSVDADTGTHDVFEHVPEREITCPACHGRHRAHTRDQYCRLGPLPPGVPLSADWEPFGDAIAPAPAERVYSCPACRGHHRRHTYDYRCRQGPREGQLGEYRANAINEEPRTSSVPEGAGWEPVTQHRLRARTRNSMLYDEVGMPAACEIYKVTDVADSDDDRDPTVLEYQKIQKENGIQPTTMREVRTSVGHEREAWRLAMQVEVDSLRDNESFEVASAREVRGLNPKKILPMNMVVGVKRDTINKTEKKKGQGSCLRQLPADTGC